MKEIFFMGNEVKNSWGTLATTDKLIKENPKMVGGFVRATIKALRYLRQDKRALSRRWYNSPVSHASKPLAFTMTLLELLPAMGLLTTKPSETISPSSVRLSTPTKPCRTRGPHDCFAQEADQQLNKAGWKP